MIYRAVMGDTVRGDEQFEVCVEGEIGLYCKYVRAGFYEEASVCHC